MKPTWASELNASLNYTMRLCQKLKPKTKQNTTPQKEAKETLLHRDSEESWEEPGFEDLGGCSGPEIPRKGSSGHTGTEGAVI